MARAKTQRQRAEEWANACVSLGIDKSIDLTTGDWRITILGGASKGHAFTPEAVEAVRRVLVETWLRARRVRP